MDWFREEDLLGCNCYIAQHNNDEVLAKCASGGAFAAIASAFVKNGGIVFGAVYDSDMRIVHMSTDSVEGIQGMLGSKYVQSCMGDCFRSAEQHLRAGRKVLFSGTPCQVAGLNAYLGARGLNNSVLENLFCIDFVCHGVGSPMVFESYVAEERNAGFDIAAINMRSKHHGYRNSSMELVGKNGKVRYVSTRVDRFLGAFFSNCISRPSCHECAFKGVRRSSAITLWDSWGAEGVLGKKTDNRGYSNVIARGEKGKLLLLISEDALTLNEVKFLDIAPRNGGMLANSCEASGDRERFLELVADKGIGAATDELLPIGLRDHVRELVKSLFWHFGMLDIVSRGKRAMK